MAGNMITPKTRKPHKKSRNGCLPCKARHVKCDEQKPACINCDKYGSKCEYPKSKRSTSDAAPSPLGLETPSSTHSQAIGRPNADTVPSTDNSTTMLNIRHLRLLHHFTTVTSVTLAAHHGAEEVFTSYMVNLAFDYPFLLHAILALAALHLSRSDPNQRADYLLQAHLHHDAALTIFREVRGIDQFNFQPVLLFSSIQFPYSLAISIDTSDDVEHAFDNILANLILTRGVSPMLSGNGLFDAMKESPLGRIVPKDIEGIEWEKEEPPAETELVQLRKFSEVIHHVYPPDIIEAYKEAIRMLEVLFDVTNRNAATPSDSLLKIWVHNITPRFLELLSEKQPGALIIFAHYGVLLGRGRRYWFREGVNEQILDIAEHFVPSEWKGWLDWPKEQIRMEHTSPMETT